MLRTSTVIEHNNETYIIYKMLGIKGTLTNIKTLCILKSQNEFYQTSKGLKPKKIQKWVDGSMYPLGTMFVYDEYLPIKKINDDWFYWNDSCLSWVKFGDDQTQSLNHKYDPVFEQVNSRKVKSISSLLEDGELI